MADVSAEDPQREQSEAELAGRRAEIELMRGRIRAHSRQPGLTTHQAIGVLSALLILDQRQDELAALRAKHHG